METRHALTAADVGRGDRGGTCWFVVPSVVGLGSGQIVGLLFIVCSDKFMAIGK